MDFVSQESDRRTGRIHGLSRTVNESTDRQSEHKLCDIMHFDDHLKVDSFLLIEVRKSCLLCSATFGHFFAGQNFAVGNRWWHNGNSYRLLRRRLGFNPQERQTFLFNSEKKIQLQFCFSRQLRLKFRHKDTFLRCFWSIVSLLIFKRNL